MSPQLPGLDPFVESDQEPEALLPPKNLTDPLNELVKKVTSDEFSNERRIQVNRAQRNWLMVQGHQYLGPDFADNGLGQEIIQMVDVASMVREDSKDSLAYVFNVLGGDAKKFVAVMGQAAPNCKAVADDVENPETVRATKAADANVRDLRTKWNSDRKARIAAFHQYTTGPAFFYTPWVTSKQKYGTVSEPVLDVRMVANPDGSMSEQIMQTGTIDYANGDVELHITNVLEITIPFGKRTIEECEWLCYEYMESKYKLLALFREQLAEDRETDADDSDGHLDTTQVAQQAQASVQQPSKLGRTLKSNYWNFRRVWLDPEMYEGLRSKQLREALQQKYPLGLRITYVKDRIVALDHECKNDVWSVAKTGFGEYLIENPVCQDSVPMQQAYNKMWGLIIETILRGVPKTLVNQAIIDAKAWAENAALPVEIMPVKTAAGEDLGKAIQQLPAAKYSDQLPQAMEALRAQMQDISGIRPEIAGGGAPTTTFREARQRRDQALLQLSPPADELRNAFERAYENGVRLRAKYGTGRVTTSGAGFGEETDSFDMSELSIFGWHVEADEGIPMSHVDRSDRLNGYLKEMPPEMQMVLGLMDPVNTPESLDLLGLPGFKAPMADERDKVLDVIQQLLREPPIQQPDMMTGQMQDIPTVPPEENVDNYQFNADLARKWCNSRAGRAAKTKNPDGYRNVVAYIRANDMKMAAMQAPPPGAPPAGPNGQQPPAGETAPAPPPAAPGPPSPLEIKPDQADAPLPPLPPEGGPGAPLVQ